MNLSFGAESGKRKTARKEIQDSEELVLKDEDPVGTGICINISA